MLNDLQNEAVGVHPSALRVELPPVPEWFRRELSQIAERNGHPMFRVVNGQTETCFRNGKIDIKHLFQTDQFPCYVPVIQTLYHRLDAKNDEVRSYKSISEARADSGKGLSDEIRLSRQMEIKALGRPCYVIEVYIAPEEIGEKNWEAGRYGYGEKFGVPQKIDRLGPFPSDGRYIYGFSVIDEKGRACAPNQTHLEECRRRWKIVTEPQPDYATSVRNIEEGMAEFVRKTALRLADNVYQYHGIAMRRFHHGTVSKPILYTKEGTIL